MGKYMLENAYLQTPHTLKPHPYTIEELLTQQLLDYIRTDPKGVVHSLWLLVVALNPYNDNTVVLEVKLHKRP